jgi:hypothetical protein
MALVERKETIVDLFKWLIGTGAPIGMSHKTADGKAWAADNIHQVIPGPLPDQHLLCKGHIAAPSRFEELRVVTVNGKRYLARGYDTSDRPNVYRLTEGALPVSPWCPLDFELDDWFRRAAVVTRFDYATGKRVSEPATHVTWLHFDDIVFEWSNPGGLYVGKVIVLTVHDGEDGQNKPPFETYIYAEDYGMVYWKDHASGRQSYVNNLRWPDGIPVLSAEPLPKGHTWQPMPSAPVVTPPAAPGYRLRPVVAPYQISSPFGPRENATPKDHKGVDYVPSAPYHVRASKGGVVTFAGWNDDGFGNLIIIDEGGGFESLYAHLASFAVTKGETVAEGQHIGVAGSTGNSDGLHLHWELRKDGVPVNPADYNVVAEPPVVTPTPEPEPEPTPPEETSDSTVPLPPDGLAALHLTIDEARQFQAALVAERDAKNEQIRILAAALARAGAA